jgi:hypothetical protein
MINYKNANLWVLICAWLIPNIVSAPPTVLSGFVITINVPVVYMAWYIMVLSNDIARLKTIKYKRHINNRYIGTADRQGGIKYLYPPRTHTALCSEQVRN